MIRLLKKRIRALIDEELDGRWKEIETDVSLRVTEYIAKDKKRRIDALVRSSCEEQTQEFQKSFSDYATEKMDIIAPTILKDHLPKPESMLSDSVKQYIKKTVQREVKAYMKEAMKMEFEEEEG